MKRRNFCAGMMSLPAAIGLAKGTEASAGSSASTPQIPESVGGDVRSQIAHWERVVRQSAPTFNWEAHNSLRHLYADSNLEESMRHTDVILQHHIMDGYIVGILSEWHDEGDAGYAVAALQDKAERFNHLPHVRAACLIAAGDCCFKAGKKSHAEAFYAAVGRDAEFVHPQSLSRYRTLANFRLT